MTNPTIKPQLTHCFKNTFSKTSTPIANIAGLNHLKYLFSTTLLVLSLNVSAVENAQQFDKEAYLDFSKPYTYNWNNPQSYTKKDNQATILLKEVGGIVRNAIGSTDSDNVKQLGSKVTTGISNQLKNKVISKTEGVINDKANKFVNQFGSGRSEISIYQIESKNPTYSIKTIQPLSKLDSDSKDLTFFQGQLASGENHGERRNTVNLGVGHRRLIEGDRAIAGINLFSDYEFKSAHQRLGLGLEYQRSNFSAHINTYYPISNRKVIGDYTEEALAGYDLKLIGQVPYLPWAKIKGTRYYWDGKQGPNIRGTVLGVEIELTPSINVELGTEKSNTADRASYMRLTTQLPFKDNESFTNFSIDSKPFKNVGIVNLTDLSPVERNNKIRIEKIRIGGSNTRLVVLGEYNAITTGATCTLFNASGVAVANGSDVTAANGRVSLSGVVLATTSSLYYSTCTGGRYTDEATGQTVDPAPTLRAATVYSGAGDLAIFASPLSEVAYRLSDTSAGDFAVIASAIETQNDNVATAFGLGNIDIITTTPTNINTIVASNDNSGQFAVILAAISQMSENANDASPDATITALVNDMNGTDGSNVGTIEGRNAVDVLTAIDNFETNGGANNSSNGTGSGNIAAVSSATGVGSIKDNLAIAKISLYDGTNSAPTLQDYIDVGVSGVSAGNLAQINLRVATATQADSDTTAEIQALVTVANANIVTLANIGTDNDAGNNTNTAALTAAQLNALTGVSGAIAANEAAYRAYIADSANTFAAPATEAEVQAMVTAVNATATNTALLLANIGTDNDAGNNANTAALTAAQLNALTGVSGAIAANEAAYRAYIADSANTFAAPATEAEVQAMVTAVNATATNTALLLANIGTDNDAGNNANTAALTAAQLNALTGVSGAIAANEAAYRAYIADSANTFAAPATEAEVQAMVTAVNATATNTALLLANIGTDNDAGNNANTAALTAAQLNALTGVSGAIAANEAAYRAYIADSANTFAAPATEAEVQAMVTAVNATATNTALLLANIGTDNDAGNNANTAALTAAQLNALTGVSGAIAANEAAYRAYIADSANTFAAPATEAEVQAMVTAVNTTAANTALLANIGIDNDAGNNTNTAALTAAQLNALTGVSGAIAANEAAYRAYIADSANTFAAPATEAEVQAMVTAVNATATNTALLLANIGIDNDAGNNTNTAALTAAQLNALTGVSGAIAANEAAYRAYIADSANTFAAPATEAEVQAMVTAVNATATNTALLLANIGTDNDAGNNANTAALTAAQLNALTGVSGAIAANEAAYRAYIADSANTFAAPATEAEVQAMVTAVNATATNTALLLANIGTDNDAGNNANTAALTAAQLNALTGVSGAIAANEAAYRAYIADSANTFAAPATEAEVQAMVTAVNATATNTALLLANIGTDNDAGNNANTAALTAAQLNALTGVSGAIAANEAAYRAYIADSANTFAAPATEAEVQAMVTAVNATATNTALLLANIGTDNDAGNNANTAALTAAQLNALTGVSGAIAANEAAYRAYIADSANTFAAPATEAEVQAMVTAVNTTAANTALLANIGIDNDAGNNTNTAALTAAQLNALTGVSGAIAANEAAYRAYIADSANTFAAPATEAEVQAMVTAVNTTAANTALLANIGTDADNGNNTNTGSLTAAELNALTGVSGAIVGSEAAYRDYINDNASAAEFSSPATEAQVQVMITKVAGTDVAVGTYRTVLSPGTHKIWLDRNLGATQVATSSTDSAAYGNLYQWGRNDDGHEDRTNTSESRTLATSITNAGTNLFITNGTAPNDWTSADSNGVLRTAAWADGGANDICPAGFSVPTEAELTADTISATTTDITDSATAFASFLKIPIAGLRLRSNGTLIDVGSNALLWSRSAGGSDGRFLFINNGDASFRNGNRAHGLSVRCIRD